MSVLREHGASLLAGAVGGAAGAAWLVRPPVGRGRRGRLRALERRVAALEACLELALDPQAQRELAAGLAELAEGQSYGEDDLRRMLEGRAYA